RPLGHRRIFGNEASAHQPERGTDRLVLKTENWKLNSMSTIQLRTPIPGPRSQDLMRRRNDAVVRAVSNVTPVFVAKAEGATIEDVDGNRMIDFAGGIGCLNTGHRAPGVVEAIRRQLDRFLHTSINVLPYESYVAVAEKLNAITPGRFAKKTLLV